MSCISLYTGWTAGGEVCSTGSGNAVASSISAAASDVRDPSDGSTILMTCLISLIACAR